MNFASKGILAFLKKVGPAKISRYMVLQAVQHQTYPEITLNLRVNKQIFLAVDSLYKYYGCPGDVHDCRMLL